jgi:phospholipase C
MSMFNSTSVPVISTLAQEFALFDHWFASIPGPTMPNRMMSMAGQLYHSIVI